MAISASKFKQDCLELIRRVERTGRPVTITRRGKVVARLMPSSLPDTHGADRPWQQLLHSKARLELPLPFADWLDRAADPRMVALLPLDRGVVIALDDLPTSFHGDPADRLIVATARAHDLPLATRDRAIRRSRTVELWKP